MKFNHINRLVVKETVFIAFIILSLTTYETLSSPIELRDQFLTGLFAWHLGMLLVVGGTTKILDNHLFRNWFRCSFRKIAFSRIVIYLLLSALIASSSIFFYKTLLPVLNYHNLFWSLFVFHAFIYFTTSVSMEASKLVGKSFIGKLLLGSYHQPKNEKRIFLFIDLRKSTQLSKELSLENYSLLIKEFFRDIEKAMEKYNGEIYQYAGDEVIISWPASVSNYDNAVRSFIEFYDQMKVRRSYYTQQYGAAPLFKAAIHSGKVVATWVGRMKRELVFQGEVLNTTARITGLAKNLNYPLLLTHQVANKLSIPLREQVLAAGDYSLKGLSVPVSVYFLRMSPVSETYYNIPMSTNSSVVLDFKNNMEKFQVN